MTQAALRREFAPHMHDLDAVIAQYPQSSPEDQAAMALKREHSFRVMANAAMIAECEGYSGEVRHWCVLAGVFHDAGRFPQYDGYKTFHDPSSVNHARLGVVTLKRAGLPQGVDTRTKRIVLTAIMLHNRRFLPAGLRPELATVAHCVRDADKLDILRVMLDHFTGRHADLPVVQLHVQDDPERYSQAIYDQAFSGGTGEYAAMRWVNDFKLLLLTWVYGMQTRTARRALLERDLIRGIADTLPETPAMERLRGKLLRDMETLAAGRPGEGS